MDNSTIVVSPFRLRVAYNLMAEVSLPRLRVDNGSITEVPFLRFRVYPTQL
jgi:hypothetical protein